MSARRLDRAPLVQAALLLAAILWAIMRVGIGAITGVADAASNAFGWPSNELSDYSAFTSSSPVGAIIFTSIGNSGERFYLLLHAVATLVSIIVILSFVWCMASGLGRTSAIRVTILSPWVALLIIFLGSYDPFTIFGFGLLLWSLRSKSWVLSLLAGFYLGFQHFEQSVVAIVAVSLVIIAVRENLPHRFARREQLIGALAGAISGKIILTIILEKSSDSETFGRSVYWTGEWFRISAITSVNFGAVFLMSLFAGLWGLVGYVFIRSAVRERLFLGLAFFVLLVPAILTLDHTRVFVMGSMLSLTVLTISVYRNGSEPSGPTIKLLELLAWIIIPISVWVGMDGTPYLHPVGSLDQLIIFVRQWII